MTAENIHTRTTWLGREWDSIPLPSTGWRMFASRVGVTGLCVCVCIVLSSCTYLRNAVKQAGYARTQARDPSQHNLKHMIDRQTYFVYGRVHNELEHLEDSTFLVAAFCSRYEAHELVDMTPVTKSGTHFGLNLPVGEYDVVVLADHNHDRVFEASEVAGRRRLQLDPQVYPERVVANADVRLSEKASIDWSVRIPAPDPGSVQTSLFYPQGTIRQLTDPLFDPAMASLGMYEPATFLEQAPTMFFALEEDSYKIPVIFVHGIGGSARDFGFMVDRLDRQRYQPWFFYYASGTDLDQLADLFYDIFLSGTVNGRGEMPVAIVAHSMGGLVVREALNRYQGSPPENRVVLLVTLASPFDGHPAAAAGVKRAPMVIPSWRDLDPGSTFIKRLFRSPLVDSIDHQLLYAKGDGGMQQRQTGTDGVVPLESQLRPEARKQSRAQLGFNASHTGILSDEGAVAEVLAALGEVESIYPAAHLEALALGGFDVAFGNHYTLREKYHLRSMGKYLSALANGTLDPLGAPYLEQFVAVARGKKRAKTEYEHAWVKFAQDYPSLARIQP